MTEHAQQSTPLDIRTPEQLQAAMGTPYAASPQQWRAISAPLAPAVVVAGAGSGKTTLMAARVVHLVLTGQVRPDEVLGLTFTTKAASELRSRIRDALRAAGVLDVEQRPLEEEAPDDALEPTVLTYHAYAANLLSEHGLLIGHEPDTRVITDAARYQLGARVVDSWTGDVRSLSDHPPTVIQNLLALDSAMSEHLVSPADVERVDAQAAESFRRALAQEEAGKNRKTWREPIEKALHAIARRQELLGLVGGYRRLKADLGLMDFSDQIELGARLASEQSSVGAVERGKFKVVLLDEYQDTSVAQAVMLGRLFSGPTPETGLGHAVTAVGDPNQAIYGWRGASVSNILGFEHTFPANAGETVPTYPLTVNRRSDRRILDAANRLAGPLLDAYPQVEPLEAKPEADDGTVEVAVHETHADELSWLTGQVRAVHEGGQSWSEIGVLVRDNQHAADVFDALTAAGVPVEIVGLSGLLRLPEVAEVVAVLTLLHDVTANDALLTLLTGPRWAIGPRDLRLLAERAKEIAGVQTRVEHASVLDHLVSIADGVDPAEVPSLDDALSDPGDLPYSEEARERFGLLAGELRSLRSSVGEPLLDVVRRIIDTTGADVELASAVSPAAEARRDNLDLFVKAVADFQAVDGAVTLPALLAYLTAEDDQGNGLDLATPTLADSVKLLTVHRSKGLEWGTVFLVGTCETRFPSNRSRTLWTSSPAVLPAPLRGDAADLPQLQGHDKPALDAYRQATRAHDAEEELRLGYVAVTRAAHRLAVTSYCWSERATPFGPSEYQRTLKEQLEEWGLEVPGWREKPAKGDPNPYDAVDPSRPWPATETGREGARRRPRRPRRGPRHARGGRGRRLGHRARPAARRGPSRPRHPPRGAAAQQPVRHRRRPAPRGPGRLRARAGPAHAAAAVVGGPLRHPLPRLGRGALRPAGPLRRRRPPRSRRRRHRGRGRPQGPRGRLRGGAVRLPGAAPGGGAVLAGARRPGGARAHRRGLPRGRRHLPARGLEDQPQRRRRRAAARPLPAGLGRAARPGARGGAHGVLLRAHRPGRRAHGPARSRRPRGDPAGGCARSVGSTP